jgi:hypothetical protein
MPDMESKGPGSIDVWLDEKFDDIGFVSMIGKYVK